MNDWKITTYDKENKPLNSWELPNQTKSEAIRKVKEDIAARQVKVAKVKMVKK